MSDERIVVGYDSGKLVLVVLFCLAVTVMGVWMIVAPRHGSTFERVAGAAFALFFGVILITLVRRLVRSSEGLILDREGFVDGTDATRYGRIAWTEIAEARVRVRPAWQRGMRPKSRKDLALRLRDPAAFRARWGHPGLTVADSLERGEWIYLYVRDLNRTPEEIVEMFKQFIAQNPLPDEP